VRIFVLKLFSCWVIVAAPLQSQCWRRFCLERNVGKWFDSCIQVGGAIFIALVLVLVAVQKCTG
jgi:hypothetical protein